VGQISIAAGTTTLASEALSALDYKRSKCRAEEPSLPRRALIFMSTTVG
jgi:hypothetical protein